MVGFPAGAAAQDSDGDGVADSSDALPCDASAAGLAFAPADGSQGMMMFEDHWPVAGDLDFNDLVVAYHYIFLQDAAGLTVGVRGIFDVIAVGGTYPLSLGLHLPVASSAVATVTRTVGTQSAQPLTPSTADGELVVTLSADVRELFANVQGPINSRSTDARRSGERLVVDVAFSSGVNLATAEAPFDLYIVRSDLRGHEIHRPRYAGTAAMDATLFNTGDDASQPGRAFVDSTGVPFALHIPALAGYPSELTQISDLFPLITSWAQSGGTTDTDFYTRNVNTSARYTDSNGVGPLAPGSVSYPIDESCRVQGTNRTFVVQDGPGDDTSGAAFSAFLQQAPVASTDWIMFAVEGPSGTDGAWCATRADWYVSNYLSLAGTGSSIASGAWEKWSRTEGGAWQGPYSSTHTNYFGSPCDGNAYSWCSEWGLSGRHLGFMPNRPGGETYASGFASGSGWRFEVRIGSSFDAACLGITGPTCSDNVQNQGETGLDCGGPCGACPTCSDGVQNQGEQRVDCGGPCAACPVLPSSTFTFYDTGSDDVPGTALRDFFNGITVAANDYLLFEVSGPSGADGAWCSERADWYATNYLASAGGSSVQSSGTWQKWHRAETGAWSAPATTGQSNYFGSTCDSNAWSWCSEWGLGGRYLGFMPNNSSGESYAGGYSGGNGWTLTVRVGAARLDTCGF